MNFKHRLPSTGHGIDFVVYRPAGGAGQQESRRLRLGGKHNTDQKVAEQRELPGVYQ